ncbi:hypothetical protein KIN20_003210 [Parelaphostrongylus tenuis]|uniref:Bestrophin homolog n=1 Tax=Parelaphostrongylus tenuis TaxID=148309 RepID=A0AAD5LWC4_PARTN|nr:hypothetical protein KIN20_003210 [Parelaphostrongylus tenuis]
MTVSYNLDVSSVTTLSFARLLLRWRGSIWKSVITELSIWITSYFVISYIYRIRMDEDGKRMFEKLVAYCDTKLDYIPLTFMLGFFVTIVVDRWRQIFSNMGWIEDVALLISALIRGDNKEVILIRRTIIRYMVLSQVLVFRDISMRVRRRFPNMESIVTAGFLHKNEKVELDKIDIVYNKYWAPINWALSLLIRCQKEGYIDLPPSLHSCMNEIKTFRGSLAQLCNYDWVPIPIAYTQVVFLAVRAYFLICLVSRQYIPTDEASNKSVIDLYVPYMTILQFVFLVGWMKVAEGLLNPLGEDDDDFECNFLIDKNIATGLSIVDETHGSCPTLLPDLFMDPNYAPVYSEDSQKNGHDGMLVGSAEGIELTDPNEDVKMVSVDVRGSTQDLSAIGHDTRSLSRVGLRRNFSNAMNFSRARVRRTNSIQPIRRGFAKPVSMDLDAERAYAAFELSDGFVPSKNSITGSNNLTKVEEEEEEVEKSHSQDALSTLESIDEEEADDTPKKE